jgi:hypothetical protein
MSRTEDLLLAELALRSRLNAMVHERAEALREAERLHIKASRAGGNSELAPEAARWRTVAERVALEIEAKRAELRDAETAAARARGEQAEG